ncbi:MAG: DedA family protein [Gemmatimonadales bacterium]|nr:MAG: DedA family protein [Gemmatimonadales bacterium]
MIPITPEDILRTGPILLFGMAVAETAAPAGVVVPAGVALATAAGLAHGGYLGWDAVLLASMGGALVGDSLGYWLGRRGLRVGPLLPERARAVAARARLRTERLFATRALLAVTGGRVIAFVRTLMPTTAGMSGISYPRFLLFDLLGIVLWAALYVALGIGAVEGLRAMVTWERPGVLPTLLILALLAFGVLRLRILARRRAALGGDEEAELL